MKSILANRNFLAYLVSPALSAVIFYFVALFMLTKGDYLPGIEITLLYFAVPLSYVGVLIFGLPGLWLLRKVNSLNLINFLAMSYFAGFLTVLTLFTGVAVIKRVDNFKEVYASGLEPSLAAGISAVVGAFIFVKISGILEK